MAEIFRKHPLTEVYFKGKKIVSYYAMGDNRNSGECTIQSAYQSSVSVLEYAGKQHNVIGRVSYVTHKNGETTMIYMCTPTKRKITYRDLVDALNS